MIALTIWLAKQCQWFIVTTKKLDSAKRILGLVDANWPKIAAEFRRAVARVKDHQTLAEIERLITEGRIDDAMVFIETIAVATATATAVTFSVAAGDTGELISRVTNTPTTYDNTNPRATRQMRDNQLLLVREFTQGQRDATRQALIRGIEQGLNPRDQARAFRDSIGLTANQEQAVENYRQLLERNSKQALDRGLRDRRFDSSVNRAVRDKKPLSQSQIDRMVERYRERYIKHRSEVIARTEALRSVHQGVDEMFEQAFEVGTLDPNELYDEWDASGDARVRNSHSFMDGQQRPIGEPFLSGNGNLLRYPGDPSAPASDSVQCRCAKIRNFR